MKVVLKLIINLIIQDYPLFTVEEVAEGQGGSAGNTSRRHALNAITPS